MKKINVEVETNIEANSDKVWSIISDFDNWNYWHKNSEMKDVELITINNLPKILKFNISNIPLKINLSRVDITEGESISWIGFLPFTQTLLSGERNFKVISRSDICCTLIQTETFHGLISRFVQKRLSIKYKRNYESLNQNIKLIAESQSKLSIHRTATSSSR